MTKVAGVELSGGIICCEISSLVSRAKDSFGCGELLKLLGGDANDPVPSSIEEAKMIHEDQEDENHVTYRTATRLDNSCMKVCYGSQSEANSATRHRLNKGSDTSRLRTYFCDECKAWHMTSSFH